MSDLYKLKIASIKKHGVSLSNCCVGNINTNNVKLVTKEHYA